MFHQNTRIFLGYLTHKADIFIRIFLGYSNQIPGYSLDILYEGLDIPRIFYKNAWIFLG